MDSTAIPYDVIIAGGGLAGLALAIQLSRKGYRTALFEKEKYPFHKVCGEYISLESWDFLCGLGVPLDEWKLPQIHRLRVSAPGGNFLDQPLPLGGFGVSRYTLDAAMAAIAQKQGVTLYEQTKVEEIKFEDPSFLVQSSAGIFRSALVAAAFGKRSNLDIKWKRPFLSERKTRLNNFIGIKYHVQIDLPDDQIFLHNFSDGYCGLSSIENGKACLCYMTTAKNLRKYRTSIPAMEQELLSQNPHLEKIFSSAKLLYRQPEVISQISFAPKSQVEDHVLCVGDAAGMITPLCGNGMSMALHGSKLAFACMDDFLTGKINRQEMERRYSSDWKKHFSHRLRMGRLIQRFFGNPRLSNVLIAALRSFPTLMQRLIRSTHGSPY